MLPNTPFIWPGSRLPACLLLHGLGGGVFEMHLLAQHLRQQGYPVQGINYPGHDQPAPVMPPSTWIQWAEAIQTAYDSLRQHYPKVALIGLSTGCPLALNLAHKQAKSHPVEKLVLMAPFLSLKREPYFPVPLETLVNRFANLLPVVPRFDSPVQDPVMRKAAAQARFHKTFNLKSVQSALDLIERVKPTLPGIQSPVLIIQSPHDSVVDPAGAEQIYQEIGSSQKQLIWLKQSNHLLPIDLEREEVFKHITSFLEN